MAGPSIFVYFFLGDFPFILQYPLAQNWKVLGVLFGHWVIYTYKLESIMLALFTNQARSNILSRSLSGRETSDAPSGQVAWVSVWFSWEEVQLLNQHC